MTTDKSTRCVELRSGQVLDVSRIIMLDKVFKNGTESTLDILCTADSSLTLHGTEAELQSDYEVIKRAMLDTKTERLGDYRVACELRFADAQSEFRVDEQQVWVDNQYVRRSQLVGELTTTKIHFLGALIEVVIPNAISATFIIIGLLPTHGHYRNYLVRSTSIYWYDEKLRTNSMLTQRPQEPVIPHDQPMHGRCYTCGAVVQCKFSDCKVVDDPPLGRVATVACPNSLWLPITGATNEKIKKNCGAAVRMAQTRDAK